MREKEASRRTHKKKRRIIRVVIVALVVIGFFTLLFRLPVFRITAVTADGNQLVQSDELVEAAWSQLLGNYLLIIPNNNIFFLRTNRFRATLMEHFPRIAELEIDRGNVQTLQLIVHERPHAFIWCGDSSMTQCYFADDKGLLFARAPYFSGSVFLAFAGGDVSADHPIDAYIINDSQEFTRLITIVHALEDDGFSVTHIGIGLRDNYTLSVSHIHGTRTPDADVVITTAINPDVLLHNIKLAMDTDEFATSFAAHPETLDYIDARLDEKVFYKFGVQPQPEPEPVSAVPAL